MPAPKARVVKPLVLFNEPLSRGNGSKPHMAEFLYRKGGETVYVCNERPQGLPSSGRTASCAWMFLRGANECMRLVG